MTQSSQSGKNGKFLTASSWGDYSNYLNIDMCKFESVQNYESRVSQLIPWQLTANELLIAIIETAFL